MTDSVQFMLTIIVTILLDMHKVLINYRKTLEITISIYLTQCVCQETWYFPLYMWSCRSAGNQPCQCTNITTLYCHNSHSMALLCWRKSLSCAEINGKYSWMKLSLLGQKILANIRPGVICAEMIDFYRFGHICIAIYYELSVIYLHA